jgi:hypothetical protein
MGITMLLATSIFSLPINTNHSKGFGFMTAPIVSTLISVNEKEVKNKK